ncbi:MAG: hypothetical protein A2284_05455 [Deltaproteobacteria bacterium RIFOXYA12_FULL_61_11]|nr:MAG: hypothetical protein A2284_05455 [Deltaproteobacteria bacterium RIFOXYA12_FULL_61_11]
MLSDQTSYTDEELMELYIAGEVEAFAELMRRYRRRIYSFLRTMVGNDRETAEELFQETFLRLVRVKRFGSYLRSAKFSTYLYTIARNVCIDHFRRRRGVFERSLDDETVVPLPARGSLGDDPERLLLEQEQRDLVSSLVTGLPAEQREVVYLRLRSDMPFKEIARVTGTGENTAKSRYRYAIESLSRQLTAKDVPCKGDLSTADPGGQP